MDDVSPNERSERLHSLSAKDGTEVLLQRFFQLPERAHHQHKSQCMCEGIRAFVSVRTCVLNSCTCTCVQVYLSISQHHLSSSRDTAVQGFALVFSSRIFLWCLVILQSTLDGLPVPYAASLSTTIMQTGRYKLHARVHAFACARTSFWCFL